MKPGKHEDIHGTVNPNSPEDLHKTIASFIRTDFAKLDVGHTVDQALRVLRQGITDERIVYFYVTDSEGHLVGVIPTRRLLTSMPDVLIRDIMATDIIAINRNATVLELSELFVKHKLLAFPVVDDEGRMRGVIDAGMFTEETINLAERHLVDDVFQLIGFGISQIKGKSAVGIFRFRFPWLIATMISGSVCAILTGAYETTLAETIVLAFFITLVLALGESVSIQSMTVALQKLHFGTPTLSEYLTNLRREGTATLLLGAACGLTVATIAFLWRGLPDAAAIIGISVVLSVTAAGVIGMSIPTLLHAIHEDSKIAAGPITLAITDIMTLLFYFNVAAVIGAIYAV